MSNLKPEFDFYLAHQSELVSQYEGKYLVIKDEGVRGAYESLKEAIETAIGNLHYLPGDFLVQRCTPGNSDYTQTFHSRVSFA